MPFFKYTLKSFIHLRGENFKFLDTVKYMGRSKLQRPVLLFYVNNRK